MSTEAKVGLFVVIAAVLVIGTIYYVGNEQWGPHVVPYRTYLRYAGGVEPGSEVLFGGITVGRVTVVRAWNQDPTEIELLLEVKGGTPINASCIAKLGTVSLMASPAISITTGSNQAARLKPGATIPSEETVSIDDMARKLAGIADTAQGLIAEVQGEIKGISGQANTVLANLNEATGSGNRRQLAQILSNTNTMIAQQSAKIDRITEQVLTATARRGCNHQEGGAAGRPRRRYRRKRELYHRSTPRAASPGPVADAGDDGTSQEPDREHPDRCSRE